MNSVRHSRKILIAQAQNRNAKHERELKWPEEMMCIVSDVASGFKNLISRYYLGYGCKVAKCDEDTTEYFQNPWRELMAAANLTTEMHHEFEWVGDVWRRSKEALGLA